MSDIRIEKIYATLKAEVIAEKDANLQWTKAEQLIFYCWKNYPLHFNDVDLELALDEQMIIHNPINEPQNNHIIYVASTLFAVGGHSRCILNFIDNQPNYKHTVILTRQHKSIPNNLTAFFQSKNVDVIIQEVIDLPLAKAKKLLLKTDEINPHKIYLFQHPDDLVPLIAFGKNKYHEVIQYNHADHVFSIGTKYFSKQLEFRNTGALISYYGKNVKAPQIQVLPIQKNYETLNRKASKTKLGFDSEQKIIGSLTNFGKAKSYKGFPSLVDVLVSISAKYSNCIFLIIGLTDAEFITISGKINQVPDNIRCIGIVLDPEPYYQIFDFFIEPFPIGSGLGILEACKHGAIPIFSPIETGLCATFEVFHPYIQSDLKKATSFEAFYSTVENYLTLESTILNTLSDKIRNGIYTYHRGEKWAADVENKTLEFDNTKINNPDEFLKQEAIFFQDYQKKSTNELIEHLLSLKHLFSKKCLLAMFLGSNRLFSFFDLNKQNIKRIAIKILKP